MVVLNKKKALYFSAAKLRLYADEASATKPESESESLASTAVHRLLHRGSRTFL
jgi:hypothetical protein